MLALDGTCRKFHQRQAHLKSLLPFPFCWVKREGSWALGWAGPPRHAACVELVGNKDSQGFEHVASWCISLSIPLRISEAVLALDQIEPAAGAVLHAILMVSRSHEITPTVDRTVPVTQYEIKHAMTQMEVEGYAVVDKEDIPKMVKVLLDDTFDLMSSAHSPWWGHGTGVGVESLSVACAGEQESRKSRVQVMPDGDISVSANLKRMMDVVRQKQVEGVIRDRFGGPACRIYRLLFLKRQLEQKQISDMAMLPIKETREILYKLLKAGYVTLQEVAKTADHNPQKTFYLWRVDVEKAVCKLASDLVQVASNLRSRLHHEISANKDLLALLEQVQGTEKSGSKVVLTEAQRTQLKRVRNVTIILETRLIKLDDLIFLFHHA
ncbi:hypothetical protein CYMTET_48583 [Cymbomonas tetramitiformis]|uniref:DNA-directed RNA polymerase III subunit RPC3 n=1 Tax=Cymbomonas tetramitiformis TaxID=36881 RepID=A0AAE0BRY7_9CHLO|nr:hypothetical protein CYMTET_48583 [Cymbomonas tetramitiformis]